MFEKLLDSIELMVFQFIVDIVLVPTTIFRLFQKSTRCFDFITEELNKNEDQQFKNTLSPIKLSIYTTAVLSLLVKNIGGLTNFLPMVSNLGLMEKFIVLFFIINTMAILFSLVLISCLGEQVSSVEFRKVLSSFIYASVYIVVPFIVLYTVLIISGLPLTILKSYVNGAFMGSVLSNKQMGLGIMLLGIVILGIVGAIKSFKAYHYIIIHIFPNRKKIAVLLTILFFIAQLVYGQIFL